MECLVILIDPAVIFAAVMTFEHSLLQVTVPPLMRAPLCGVPSSSAHVAREGFYSALGGTLPFSLAFGPCCCPPCFVRLCPWLPVARSILSLLRRRQREDSIVPFFWASPVLLPLMVAWNVPTIALEDSAISWTEVASLPPTLASSFWSTVIFAEFEWVNV